MKTFLFLAKLLKLVFKITIIYLVLTFLHAFIYDSKYPGFGLDNVIGTFGKEIRIQLFQVDDLYPRRVLSDIDKSEYEKRKSQGLVWNKSKMLDRNVYAYDNYDGFFFTYCDDVFYSYGSTGFMVIYAEPFKIKLLRNENLSGEWRETTDDTLKQYSSDELYLFSSINEFTEKEQEAYKRLQFDAQWRIKKLKEVGLYQ